MNYHKTFSRTLLSVSITALLFSSTHVFAETTFAIGLQGVNGAASDGFNAGDVGGKGGTASAVANASDLINSASARGGSGGAGGAGVNGDTVRSYDAGHGGVGGAANAISGSTTILNGNNVDVKADAFGGVGGNGGNAGGLSPNSTPTDPRLYGFNGLGGNGGDATANASALTTLSVSVSVNSNAIGGAGGTAGTAGKDAVAANAGDGGKANAIATASGSTVDNGFASDIITVQATANGGRGGRGIGLANPDGVSGKGLGGNGGIATASGSVRNNTGSASLSINAVGGDGGQGSDTGRGGHGADTILINAASGTAAKNLLLSQSAVGGAGGGSSQNGGGVGRAGNASSALTLQGITAATVTAKSTATGGKAGLAVDTHAVDGGSADSMIFINSSSSKVNVLAEATGANGGIYEIFAPGAIASGGDGGSARLGGVGGVYGISTSGGDVSVTGRATGGSGGGSLFTSDGRGGNGASVNLNNSVDGDTVGILSLRQEATGGNSGRGNNAVLTGAPSVAGSATSTLSKSTSSTRLILNAIATAGHGGNATNGTASSGANALANVRGNNDAGALDISAIATGGKGGNGFAGNAVIAGRGGDASAISNGQNTGTGLGTSQSLTVRASASGGDGGWDRSLSSISEIGDGGNAVSSATGNGIGTLVTVNSGASGGIGVNGGSARSTARATGASAAVSANSTGGQGFIRGGNAISRAESIVQGRTNASASSSTSVSSGGQGSGRADASSIASGSLGTAQSNARSQTVDFRNSVNARAIAAVAGSNAVSLQAATSQTSASSGISEAIPDFAQASGMQSVAFASLLPDQAAAKAITAGNIGVEAGLADKESLAIGLMGGSFSVNGVSRSSYSSVIDLSIDMQGKDNTDLLLGLFGSTVTGDHGFDTLSFEFTIEGTQVENILFRDLATAESFFTDNVLNYGLWGDLVSADNILDLSVSLNLTEQHLGQGFNAGFVAAGGVAVVPVPATIWLFGSGLAGLFAFSRRRNKQL